MEFKGLANLHYIYLQQLLTKTDTQFVFRDGRACERFSLLCVNFLLRIYGHSRTNFLGESAGGDNSDIKLMIVQQDEIGDSLDAMH